MERTGDFRRGEFRIGEFRAALLVAAGSALLGVALTLTSPVRAFEAFLWDARVASHVASPSSFTDIAVVVIDEEAMSRFAFLSPIDRTFLADVVEKLDKRKVAAIGLDIVIDRPTLPEADAQLARAVERSAAPVVGVFDPGKPWSDAICRGRQPMEPPIMQTLLPGAARLGHGVLCVGGADDVVRDHPFGAPEPSFVEALHVAAGGMQVRRGGLELSPPLFALSMEGGLPFPVYSAAHLDDVPEDWLRGRIVLVGSATPYGGDWRLTPLRLARVEIPIEPKALLPTDRLPGVAVHAFALARLRASSPPDRPDGRVQWLLALLGAAAGTGLARARLAPGLLAAAVTAALAFVWTGLFVLDREAGINLPFSGFSLALCIAAAAAMILAEARERRMRQAIHSMFRHFLAPAVVDDLARHPERLRLEAEEREISVLFTDLAGFTRFVDETPHEVVRVALNTYLDDVVDCVVRHGGVVDKIVGDAVHALFSAPVSDPEHRRNALACALDIRRRTEDRRRELARQGLHLGETRIGVNSGRAIVGHFGSSRRFDYTAHGSTVNAAARLEAANKAFGTRILAAEATCVPDDRFCFRRLGEVSLRGVAGAIRVCELLPSQDRSPGELEAYEQARALWETDPAGARGRFDALLAERPDDGLVQWWRDRAPGQPVQPG